VLATATLAASVFVPAAAPQPIVTGGLVNVTIVDFIDVNNVDVEILNDVNVAAALQPAANVCDVNVNVLAQQFRQGGDAACTNTQTLDQALID
jgi:hypothetical protein